MGDMDILYIQSHQPNKCLSIKCLKLCSPSIASTCCLSALPLLEPRDPMCFLYTGIYFEMPPQALVRITIMVTIQSIDFSRVLTAYINLCRPLDHTDASMRPTTIFSPQAESIYGGPFHQMWQKDWAELCIGWARYRIGQKYVNLSQIQILNRSNIKYKLNYFIKQVI